MAKEIYESGPEASGELNENIDEKTEILENGKNERKSLADSFEWLVQKSSNVRKVAEVKDDFVKALGSEKFTNLKSMLQKYLDLSNIDNYTDIFAKALENKDFAKSIRKKLNEGFTRVTFDHTGLMWHWHKEDGTVKSEIVPFFNIPEIQDLLKPQIKKEIGLMEADIKKEELRQENEKAEKEIDSDFYGIIQYYLDYEKHAGLLDDKKMLFDPGKVEKTDFGRELKNFLMAAAKAGLKYRIIDEKPDSESFIIEFPDKKKAREAGFPGKKGREIFSLNNYNEQLNYEKIKTKEKNEPEDDNIYYAQVEKEKTGIVENIKLDELIKEKELYDDIKNLDDYDLDLEMLQDQLAMKNAYLNEIHQDVVEDFRALKKEIKDMQLQGKHRKSLQLYVEGEAYRIKERTQNIFYESRKNGSPLETAEIEIYTDALKARLEAIKEKFNL